MQWNELLNSARRKPKKNNVNSATAKGRLQIERDYDRILFAAPTRRLADKTQVFPLDKNDSVRTRLTHSHEVANLARGIGVRLAFEMQDDIFDEKLSDVCLERDVPALLAAIGLAHDLGNPPFGHQGERAMGEWFEHQIPRDPTRADDELYNDFRKFDGNSQTFRLVTKLQILNDEYGLNLTYATLASLIKYPRASYANANKWKKHGFFHSEESVVKEVWEKTGLQEGLRHPFTFIMEACDDIAYSVLDAEDTVKKGLASFHDLMDFLICAAEASKDEVILNVVNNSKNDNSEYSQAELSPAELNDMSMQMFRVYAIAELVDAVVVAFRESSVELRKNNCSIKDLISVSKGKALCEALKEFDRTRGYQHRSVLKLELKGSNYIKGLMDMLWVGIHGHKTKKCKNDEKNGSLEAIPEHQSNTPFGRYVYGRISENYRRIFENPGNNLPVLYKEAQLLADAISGMTDSYLIALHDELKSLYEYEHSPK